MFEVKYSATVKLKIGKKVQCSAVVYCAACQRYMMSIDLLRYVNADMQKTPNIVTQNRHQ